MGEPVEAPTRQWEHNKGKRAEQSEIPQQSTELIGNLTDVKKKVNEQTCYLAVLKFLMEQGKRRIENKYLFNLNDWISFLNSLK